MPLNIQAACSWSGGKDSCYALMLAVQQGVIPKILLNMMNENGKISRSHGLTSPLLHQQAAAMELPIITIPTSWQDYEKNFTDILQVLKTTHDIKAMVFGDIDLQAHRDWEEMVCNKAGIEAMLPIWQRNRKELLLEMLEAGMKSMIVSCNTTMGEEFLGRMLDQTLIPELESKGVDVCGENGEFHTIVVDCPAFNQPLALPSFTKIRNEDYWFLQWSDEV